MRAGSASMAVSRQTPSSSVKVKMQGASRARATQTWSASMARKPSAIWIAPGSGLLGE